MGRVHFLLAPVGSSGDVHPFVGIGRVLRARGHDVTIVTSEPFRQVAEAAGLRFQATHSTEEFDRVTRDPGLWHPRKGLEIVMRGTAERVPANYATLQKVYEPGRTVLVGATLAFAARIFQEVHAVPAATIHLAPSAFRSDYEQPASAPGRDASAWPRWLKRSTWWLIDTLIIDRYIAPELNRFRQALGLPRVKRVFKSWLHSPDRVIGLFPAWFARPQADWPPQLRLTGFPLYDESDHVTATPALRDFLDAGDPPIVFTPGSANRLAVHFFAAAVDALDRLGRRGLLLTRYPEQLPTRLPESVHVERYVPLSRLLPRCAALVHHGGIGTAAQGLAAAVPQLTMPMGFDQPDNALRLQRLGVGRWVVPTRFTGARVAGELTFLLESADVAAACGHGAAQMKQTQPLQETCDLLEELAGNAGI